MITPYRKILEFYEENNIQIQENLIKSKTILDNHRNLENPRKSMKLQENTRKSKKSRISRKSKEI